MSFIVDHFCTLKPFSKTGVPKLGPSATIWDKMSRFAKCLFIVSPYNLQTKGYFESTSKLEQERRRFLRCGFVIHPLSIFSQYWQFMICILLYFNVSLGLIAPILQLRVKYNNSFFIDLQNFYLGTEIICCGHMLICFLTGYIENKTKNIVLDKKKIAVHYLSTYFIIDLCAFDFLFILPLYYIQLNTLFATIYFSVKLLRILRLRTANTYLRHLIIYVNLSDDKFQLLKVGIIGIILLHINSTLFICVSTVESVFGSVDEDGRPWIDKVCEKYESDPNSIYFEIFQCDKKETTDLRVFFLHSYMENMKRMSLYSIGSIMPETWGDIWMCAVSLSTGFCYQVYLFLYIMEKMRSSYYASRRYGEVIQELQNYCLVQKVPVRLQTKMVKTFEYAFKGKYFDKTYIEHFSQNLKIDLFLDHAKNYELLTKSKLLKGVDQDTAFKIISSLKSGIYLPGDVIEQYGSHMRRMYFIVTGSVAIYDCDGVELYHLREGDYFGMHAIVASTVNWQYTVIAAEVTEIYRLSKEDYIYNIMLHDWPFLNPSDGDWRRYTVDDIKSTFSDSVTMVDMVDK